MATTTTNPDGAWTRAASYAALAPEGAEAVAGILAEAAGALGARWGAVVAAEEVRCVESWGCEPSALAPLLAEDGAVREALGRLEEWIDTGLVLERRDARILLEPLRVRGLALGALLLVHEPGDPAPPAVHEVAGGFAAMLALVMENDRLYHEAREALQSRDHFLTALNHELRTPAHALLLFADLLRSEAEGSLPAHVVQALQDTETHVHQLVNVLRRVLDLGTLGDTVSPQRADIVHPRHAVADLLRRVEPAAKRKNLTLALYTPRSLPPLQTEAERFSRILLHLFSNAIKYTAKGGVEVRLERTVRRLSRHKQEPVLAIHVRDTGRGIPPDELERIFEPFTQVDEGSRTDSRSRGLGLGLPLARQLARTLGGEVTIQSTPGQGTLASLVLPYHQG